MSRTILVVEDIEVNRMLVSRYLELHDFTVVLAEDGFQALEKARSAMPDLILMDMSLPGLDGWEVTRRLKADEATRAIPVIAVTAHAMAGDREKALQAGCDEYETKPIEFTRMLPKIEEFLRRKADAEQR